MPEPEPATDLEPHPPAPSEADWLLTFTSSIATAPDGDGRPWGDGTSMAARARSGHAPWDQGCAVTPMIGGDETFSAMCETFEAAIADADARPTRAGKSKGHVYITGLQLNALRDLSHGQKWEGLPWNPKTTVEKDQTVLGFLLRMMAAGIDVRLLLWMPTTVQAMATFKPLADEHWSIAAAIEDFDAQLARPAAGRGIVALDLRTAGPTAAALHQKLVVVRVGAVNVAYCGGIDLAFSRRDYGRKSNMPTGFGDWQSGDTTPLSKDGWPKQAHLGSSSAKAPASPRLPPFGSSSAAGHRYPADFPNAEDSRFPEDLPAEVYGKGRRFWHDHHLRLEGPIVTTLEQQFAERWMLDGRVFKFDRTEKVTGRELIVGVRDNQVRITHPAPGGRMWPLAPAAPVPAVGDATVQMWRTIPLRTDIAKGPLLRGEFTIMAGVAKAVAKATELITIWDQYFWSEPLARLLAARLNAVATLRLLIVLPPYGTTQSSDELALRKFALQTLWKGLDAGARSRVKVFDLWDHRNNVGIYVHAKVQTYDDKLLVCGSANMNRRSFECDAELDCAVLHQPTVRRHLSALHACVMAEGGAQQGWGGPHPDQIGPLPVSGWQDFGAGWLAQYWADMEAGRGSGAALIQDPFFCENPGTPKTPNGVAMKSKRGIIPIEIFEPTSIKRDIADAVCDHKCAGHPNARGRLDELTFLLERCHEGDRWPWRTANERWGDAVYQA